jgi:1-acyl-sn-glycerol-3-phosphate acyltransferase
MARFSSNVSIFARRVVPITYWLLAMYARVAVRIYFPRMTVTGLANVPKRGPVIVVSNHVNSADPCLLVGVLRRRTVVMAHAGLFWLPFGALLMHLLGALRVKGRGIDVDALREATRALERGLAVVVFPEGERSRTGALVNGQPGTALLAYRADATIVPVAITGTAHVSWPWVFVRPFLGPKVTVRFGEPFRLPPAGQPAARTARAGIDVVMRHIAELLPPELRGEYGEPVAPTGELEPG